MGGVKRVSSVRCGLVFVLLFALAPGVGEVLENVAHLLTQGHWAHAREHGDDHAQRGAEHGILAPSRAASTRSGFHHVPERPPRA